jgi:hypothetical protein
MFMDKHLYTWLIGPTGKTYRELLDYALKECAYFLLVTDREQKQLSPKGKEVLNQLAPYLYKMEMKSEWPGTVILNVQVPVYIYNFIPKSAEILRKVADGLYQWQKPGLPDDLCFLRSDESPWLVSTAHESDAYFIVTDDDMERLLKAKPAFASMINRDNE